MCVGSGVGGWGGWDMLGGKGGRGYACWVMDGFEAWLLRNSVR